MTIIFTLLVALPAGFLARSRLTAFLIYLPLIGFVFTFQTAGLLLDWAGGSEEAFGGPFPEYDNAQYWSYGIVNLVVVAVGAGIVEFGHRRGELRRAKATSRDLVEVG